MITDNSDNTYKLYKSVFNNIYLSNKIYKLVRGVNRQITNSNIYSKSFSKRLRYEDITSFEWMVKNNHFHLIYDKIRSKDQSNLKLDSLDAFYYLKLFIQQSTTTKEILESFYLKYKTLLNQLVIDSKDPYKLIKSGIFSNSLEFIKIVYQDLVDSRGKISDDETLLILALNVGNLDIIKYINQVIGVQFKNYEMEVSVMNPIFINAICSENRENLILYLLDNQAHLKFIYIHKNFKVDNFLNSKLLKLSFPTFKRLINEKIEEPSSFFCKPSRSSTFQIYCSQIRRYFNYLNVYTIKPNNASTEVEEVIRFDSFLNFFQNIIYILSNFENGKYLKKINNLLNGSNSNDNIVGNLITNLFSKSSNSQVNNNNDDNDETKIEKEITRIIIFEFVKDIKEWLISRDEWVILVINFVRKYKEYHLIEQENLIKTDDSKSNNEKNLKLLCSLIIRISIKHGDSDLIQEIPRLYPEYFTNYNLDESYIRHQTNDDPNPSDYFNTNSISIEKQIKFIDIMYKYNLTNVTKEAVLNNIFNNPSLSIKDFDQIAEIIKKYQQQQQQQHGKISAELLIGNEMIFKYYFNNSNYKEIFNWDNQLISEKIIKSGNLELIQFIHDNKIGSLDKTSSINHSKSIATAQFMYNNLGFKFDGSLIEISNLDEWQSGYLFQYSINCLIKDKYLDTKDSNITLYRQFLENYKLLRFIHSKSNQLDTKRVLISKVGPIDPHFTLLKDMQKVYQTYNLNYIFNFILHNRPNPMPFMFENSFYSSLIYLSYDENSNCFDYLKNYFKYKINKHRHQ